MEISLRVFSDPESLSLELADELTASLYYGGTAALAGGSSPLRTYARLAAMCNIPWERVIFIPTDERCYPKGHPERNDTSLKKIFWGLPCRILDLYEQLRCFKKPASEGQSFEKILPFEITILGLGADGHTASLFPGNPALKETSPVVNVINAPKSPSQRISLSISTLNRSKKIFFCVTGTAKKEVLKDLLQGQEFPANMLSPEGPVYIFADRDAAGS